MDPTGDVYVTEAGNNRVQVHQHPGTYFAKRGDVLGPLADWLAGKPTP